MDLNIQIPTKANGYCDSCVDKMVTVYITWGDGETFAVCTPCAALGFEAGGEVDIAKEISRLRDWGEADSGERHEHSPFGKVRTAGAWA